MGTFPTLTFQMALANNWNTEPATWTTIQPASRATHRIRQGSIRRGRNFEFDRAETGTMLLALDNRDRAFEPGYSASPYYPNIDQGKQGRLQATSGGTTYDLFRGVADDLPPTWDLNGDAIVSARFVDAFDILKEATTSISLALSLSGSQIGALLDDIGWSSSLRVLEAGQEMMPAKSLGGTTTTGVIDAAQLIAVESELGYLFVNGAGKICFHDRWHRHQTSALTPVATFGDGGGNEIPYRSIDAPFGSARVKNRWEVTREGGVMQVASDAASITKRGRRTDTKAPRLTDDGRSFQMANHLKTLFANPQQRFERIEIQYRGDNGFWASIFGLEIGDRVTVKRRQPVLGAPSSVALSQDCHVEAIEHSFTQEDWRTTLSLSPASPVTFWRAGIVGASEAGTTNYAIY